MKQRLPLFAIVAVAFTFLASCQPEQVPEELPGPSAVDLGLSVKWYSCNLGASSPEEYGLYYQWGDTQGYGLDTSDGKCFYWYDTKFYTTYKWCDGSQTTLTKYNTKSDYGTVDNITVLELEDDAARAALGDNWRLPTSVEWAELTNKSNCSWTWTTINGVNGYKVQSLKSGYTRKWIFLPAAGCRFSNSSNEVGTRGRYFSSTLAVDSPHMVRSFSFNSEHLYAPTELRCYGLPIRPVSE